MGILILSNYEIFEGVSISNLTMTIKGDYNVKKSLDQNMEIIYCIRALIFWCLNGKEIFSEERIFQVKSVDSLNIYNFIYLQIKQEFDGKNISYQDC